MKTFALITALIFCLPLGLPAADSFELTVLSDKEWQQRIQERARKKGVKPQLPTAEPELVGGNDEAGIVFHIAEALTDAVVELVVRPHITKRGPKSIYRSTKIDLGDLVATIEEDDKCVVRHLSSATFGNWRTKDGHWIGKPVSLATLKAALDQASASGYEIETLHITVSTEAPGELQKVITALGLKKVAEITTGKYDILKLSMKETKETKK